MLINILLILLCIINPFLAIYCYRKAVQDMQRIDNKEEIKTSVELPNLPKSHKPSKEYKEFQEKSKAIDDFKVVL